MKKNNKINMNAVKNYENNLKKENKKSIFERFTLKENIVIFSIFLILVILANNFIKNINISGVKLNYKNLTAEKIIENSIVSYDREVYWRLNTIIQNVLSAEDETKGQGIDLSYYKYSSNEYYRYLTNEYKKNIGKLEFKNKLHNVISKSRSISMPIDKIYKFDNSNFYLVKLKSEESAYIGINLMTDSNTYYIFYLE